MTTLSSSSVSFPNPKVAHSIVAAFLTITAAVLVYNVATYPTKRQYDSRHHAWRARSAGLEVDRMAYNSPLYYLPAALWVDLSRFFENGKPRARPTAGPKYDFESLDRLQKLNVAYVLGALLVWIYGILPLLLGTQRSWFLASMALLGMPGFRKISVMAHPDVLLLFLASLTFFLTLRALRKQPTFTENLVLALLAGLTGACRPFAVVPMLLCWTLNVGMLTRHAMARIRDGSSTRMSSLARLGAQITVISILVATLSGGWWVYRYQQTGAVMDAYNHRYVDPYQPLKASFDYVHYYSSFYFGKLLSIPSRADVPIGPGTNPKGNSFWTQLYSDFWGDHFLYFSGDRNGIEHKLWVKRVLFVLALPFTLLLVLGIITGTFRSIANAIRRRDLLHSKSFMAAMFWGGFAIFVVWQGTAGLLPGKNSSIKFLYIAWTVPFGVGTAALAPIGNRLFWLIFVLELCIAIVALPMSLNLR